MLLSQLYTTHVRFISYSLVDTSPSRLFMPLHIMLMSIIPPVL